MFSWKRAWRWARIANAIAVLSFVGLTAGYVLAPLWIVRVHLDNAWLLVVAVAAASIYERLKWVEDGFRQLDSCSGSLHDRRQAARVRSWISFFARKRMKRCPKVSILVKSEPHERRALSASAPRIDFAFASWRLKEDRLYLGNRTLISYFPEQMQAILLHELHHLWGYEAQFGYLRLGLKDTAEAIFIGALTVRCGMKVLSTSGMALLEQSFVLMGVLAVFVWLFGREAVQGVVRLHALGVNHALIALAFVSYVLGIFLEADWLEFRALCGLAMSGGFVWAIDAVLFPLGSRYVEYRVDAQAALAMDDPEPLASALEEMLANDGGEPLLTWRERIMCTHPSLGSRIERLRSFNV